MQEEPKTPATSKTSLAVLGFISVIAAAIIGYKVTDHEKHPATNQTSTQQTTATNQTTTGETRNATGAQGGAGAPSVTGTVAPAAPEVNYVEIPAAVDISKVSSDLYKYVPETGQHMAIIPAGCDADDVVRAIRYSMEPGYAYLQRHCELVHRWKQEGGNVVDRLCDWGFDSPKATAEYEKIWNLTEDQANQIVEAGTQAFEVTAENRTRPPSHYFQTIVEWHGDVAFLDPETHSLRIRFQGPCWSDLHFLVQPLRIVGRAKICFDSATGRYTQGACR